MEESQNEIFARTSRLNEARKKAEKNEGVEADDENDESGEDFLQN